MKVIIDIYGIKKLLVVQRPINGEGSRGENGGISYGCGAI